LQPSSIFCLNQTVVFGVAYSCTGKRKVFSFELILLLLRIINLKGSCFWLRGNIEFYTENSNFGKPHFSLKHIPPYPLGFIILELLVTQLCKQGDQLNSTHFLSVFSMFGFYEICYLS